MTLPAPDQERLRQVSYRGRITAAIMLTAVTVLFFGCVLFMVEQNRLDRDHARLLESHVAAFLARSSAPDVREGDTTATRAMLTGLKQLPDVESAEIRDAGGRVLASYNSSPHSGEAITSSVPIVADGHRIGMLAIRMSAPAMALMLPRYVAMGGALFFAATALALFLGRWLAGRITEPVARLSEMMQEVGSDGDFSRRLEPSAADELGALTECFNHLLATLNHNDRALRRTMGELVTARDAAQAANIQKSQFLANMSHEIRTPLNGVLAMAQILAHGDLNVGQREQVDVIRTSGESLLEILNDILDVSKIEAGKLELETVEFDLAELAHSVQSAFTAMADGKNLTFRVDLAANAGGSRLGDATRIRQILNNLVSNAVKFTDQGRVDVIVEGDGPAGADGVLISVIDTGIGIAPDKLPLLFQKFSQLDASTTRRYGGTGLGLAICRELAELMGGRVSVESRLGEGSAFHVTLPLPRVGPAANADWARQALPAPTSVARSADATPAVLAPAESAGGAEPEALRVLAAEDNATNQLVLTTVMQIFGCDLVVVNNGREAVEAWEHGCFDVVLMDIQMPVMDGIAATAAIRAAEAASGRRRTPIIALSANALVHQVQEYLAIGMDAHVAKPLELAKLQAALERVIAVDEVATRAA